MDSQEFLDIVENETNRLATMLAQKGLQISMGSSSKSRQSETRTVYLEKAGNTAHNPNYRAYADNVVRVWEWRIKNAYGNTPISKKAVSRFIVELEEEVKNA